MAGQPVLGGPGRFGIEVAGERQAGDEDAGLALGRADGQHHAGIIDLARRPRSMLAPHPGFGAGAGVVQEGAPELAVAVAVAILLAVFFPDQHQGHTAPAKLSRNPLPVRHRPLFGHAETAAPRPPPRSSRQHRRSAARPPRPAPGNRPPSSSASGSTARSAVSNSPARGPASEVPSLVACLTFPAARLTPWSGPKK